MKIGYVCVSKQEQHIEKLKVLKERDIEFISLTEQIDMTTPRSSSIS